MKVHQGVALALAMVCLLPAAQAQPGSRAGPLPAIVVTVVDGRIVVSPTSLPSTSGPATLVWKLQTDGYRFTSASIDFGAHAPYFTCSTADFGLTVSCAKSAQAPKKQLSYRVLLSDGSSGGQAMVELPQPNVFIMND